VDWTKIVTTRALRCREKGGGGKPRGGGAASRHRELQRVMCGKRSRRGEGKGDGARGEVPRKNDSGDFFEKKRGKETV